MIDFREMLVKAIEHGASDVHINVNMPPVMRINTELVVMEDLSVLNEDDAKQMLLDMIGKDRYEKFESKRDIDFSTWINDGSRFRVNAHYQRDSIAISFRVIPKEIPDIRHLHLPDIVNELTDLPRGLILVTGHTGSGKSTTLASMIGTINQRYHKHIITLEDPVEYALENRNCMIEQREIGSDCPDFASGLRHVLRQDPDIILVGEMRDLETTSSTITAAETGHLVLSTLHTVNASQTVERIIDIYPAGQQNQIRSMLANTLEAVVTQVLFKRTDQPGMIPAAEVMICNSAVRNCIRENRIFEIPNVIETNRGLGMCTLDSSIKTLYFNGHISRQNAVASANRPDKLEQALSA